MNSIILKTAAKYLLILILLFSLWILLRGHNTPGGGFIGGLVAAAAFSLHLIAYGARELKGLLLIELPIALGLGLVCMLGSGLIGLLYGNPFLTSVWFSTIKFGTPLLFDIGIYLIVVTSIVLVIYALEEEL